MAETFTVTGITNTVYAPPGGTVGPAVEVSFTTKPHQIVGKVTLPAAAFTVEAAETAIAAEAATLERVMAL